MVTTTDLGSRSAAAVPDAQGPNVRQRSLRDLDRAEAPAEVLIAEDDPVVRHALEDSLEELGFLVAGAVGDGAAAVAAAEASNAEVIVMDVRMPRLDGIEAARRIRELPLGPEIVLLSAYGDVELREAAEAAGVRAYIPKDCPLAVLHEAIWAALLHRSLPITD